MIQGEGLSQTQGFMTDRMAEHSQGGMAHHHRSHTGGELLITTGRGPHHRQEGVTHHTQGGRTHRGADHTQRS